MSFFVLFYLCFVACFLAYFERTRTTLTSFIHSFRFPMMLFSSTMLKPVSFRSWSTYVVAGLPLFLAPCFGSQSSRSLITSSFFLQQCPINRSLLIISVSVILGRLPYLLLCSFSQNNLTTPNCTHSIQGDRSTHFPCPCTATHKNKNNIKCFYMEDLTIRQDCSVRSIYSCVVCRVVIGFEQKLSKRSW